MREISENRKQLFMFAELDALRKRSNSTQNMMRDAANTGAARRSLDGPLTVGRLIAACREGEQETLSVFGKRLGVSASHLHDVEKGRRTVSVERAARWAKALGYPVAHFVQLALQAEVAAAGLDFDVELKPANVNSSRKPSKKRAAG